MSYTEEFKNILNRREDILNTNMGILKNTKPEDLKIFPLVIREAIIAHYFKFLNDAIEDNEFVNFIPNKKEPGTLQVISTLSLPIWQGIIKAWRDKPDNNNDEIVTEDYDCIGNTILMDMCLVNGEHVYFVTRYRNVISWYSNMVVFRRKNDNAEFHEEKGKILALTPFVDAVIYNDRCYIINENNFNTIFKFDEVVKNQIKEHEAEIRAMKFVDDTDIFMNYLSKSKMKRHAMAKVLMQKRLSKIEEFAPKYIREQIENQPELSFIKYDNNNRIRLDSKKSFNAVVDILCGTINLDLITKELNGMDEYEKNQ